MVTVYEYLEHDGTPYLAMEYLERGSLRPYVRAMNVAQISGVLEGILAALVSAERAHIVHRDLKPENVLVTDDGRVKVADFGIAKATSHVNTGGFRTASGVTVGTPHYIAPEQALAGEVGPWTDLYSVGCMAFEFFTGRVPFSNLDAPMAILMHHVNQPIPPVSSISPGVDGRISEWIERLLAKAPVQRIQSPAEAWEVFEEITISLLGARWRRDARLRFVPRPRVRSTAALPGIATAQPGRLRRADRTRRLRPTCRPALRCRRQRRPPRRGTCSPSRSGHTGSGDGVGWQRPRRSLWPVRESRSSSSSPSPSPSRAAPRFPRTT